MLVDSARLDRLRQSGVRLNREGETFSVRSGRDAVPIQVEESELGQLEAVHLGQTEDRLALAVKDLGDHKFTVLEMRGAMDGAVKDRLALYRYVATGERHGRLAVRPPGQRKPLDIRSAETVSALCYFHASGQDFGLARPALAEGLKQLSEQDFSFHGSGSDSRTVFTDTDHDAFRAYCRVVEQQDKVIWVSSTDGPRIPFNPTVVEQPDQLIERYALARTLDPLLPPGLNAQQRADFWEAAYSGPDPEERMRCLARLSQVSDLRQSAHLYGEIACSFEPQDRMRVTDALVDLAGRHGVDRAAEALPLMAVTVEGEALEERAELFGEILSGPAGSPGATANDRKIDYVREAITRFAQDDPAGTRQRLSQVFVLERGGQPPTPPQAVGQNDQGNLVIGGVVVRPKRGSE